MNEEFLTVFRILRIYGDGNGTFGTNEELIARMGADTGYQNEERAFMEMVLTTVNADRHEARPPATRQTVGHKLGQRFISLTWRTNDRDS